MTPQIGQYIKVFFRNGMQAEGIVQSWSEMKSVLLIADGKDLCLILKTEEDVILVQMINDISKTKVGLREHMNELEEQFQETYKMPSADELRIKKLSDLKQMMIEQEKKIIKDKMVDHNIPIGQGTTYGLPSIFKK
jgi:sRNA-binding regulator protein Hfq